MIQTIAPGKLILSGEHAVVHGCPAIVMAVNQHVQVRLTPQHSTAIKLLLPDLAQESDWQLADLKALSHCIATQADVPFTSQFSVNAPIELVAVTLALCIARFDLTLSNVVLEVQSQIPVGSGMGSSAAVILAVINAVLAHCQKNFNKEIIYQVAKEAENFQHGKTSGLDLRIALQGGCIYMHQDKWEMRALPTFPLYYVNTGRPLSTTGEAVAKTSAYFQKPALLEAFTSVTARMDKALSAKNKGILYETVRENHRLLSSIGVVPACVARFIAALEQQGAAAKIAGAGAAYGECAGIVWMIGEDSAKLTAIAKAFGYTLQAVNGEMRGVHAV